MEHLPTSFPISQCPVGDCTKIPKRSNDYTSRRLTESLWSLSHEKLADPSLSVQSHESIAYCGSSSETPHMRHAESWTAEVGGSKPVV